MRPLAAAVLLALSAVAAAPPLTRVLAAGYTHQCALLDDATARCFGDAHGPATQLPAGVLFVQITAGAGHSCALRADVRRGWGALVWGAV